MCAFSASILVSLFLRENKFSIHFYLCASTRMDEKNAQHQPSMKKPSVFSPLHKNAFWQSLRCPLLFDFSFMSLIQIRRKLIANDIRECWQISLSSYRNETHTRTQSPTRHCPTSTSQSLVIFRRSQLTLAITSADWKKWRRRGPWPKHRQKKRQKYVERGSWTHGFCYFYFISRLLPLIWFNDLKNHKDEKTVSALAVYRRRCLSLSVSFYVSP